MLLRRKEIKEKKIVWVMGGNPEPRRREGVNTHTKGAAEVESSKGFMEKLHRVLRKTKSPRKGRRSSRGKKKKTLKR